MDDREFEQFMKDLGKKVEAERGSYMLNPAAIQKASIIMKKLNEIKDEDTDNDRNIEIKFNVSDLVGYFATISFTFESFGIVKEEYESIFEIMKIADSITFVPGYKPDTVTIDFIIDDYIVLLK